MVNLYQSLIDRCVAELISIDSPDNVPDWVDPFVLDDFESVDSIKVTNVDTFDDDSLNETVLNVNIHIDIVFDSLRYIHPDNLQFHLEYYIKRNLFGPGRDVIIQVIADNVDLKNKNPQW